MGNWHPKASPAAQHCEAESNRRGRGKENREKSCAFWLYGVVGDLAFWPTSHRGMRGWVDECEIERWRLRDLEVYQPIFIWLRWTISGWAFAGGTSFPLVWEILFGRNWALEGGCERVELSFSHCRTEKSTELPFLQRLTTNSPYEQLCNDTLIDLEVNIIARR